MERTDLVEDLSRAVTELVEDARRGMEGAFDLSRIRVLQVVALDGPLRPGDISRTLRMAASSVTRHMQALEDAGQVRVSEHPDDARTCMVQATKAGHDELRRIGQTGASVFSHVVADWDAEDLRVLTGLLRRLTEDWARRGHDARTRSRPAQPPRWRHAPTDTHKPEEN